jgi:hypothetical protein
MLGVPLVNLGQACMLGQACSNPVPAGSLAICRAGWGCDPTMERSRNWARAGPRSSGRVSRGIRAGMSGMATTELWWGMVGDEGVGGGVGA